MIKDVLDALKVVADGIDSVKSILDAVKTGANYLKAKHPDVQGEVQKLVAELGKSVGVIKAASAVLTNFRFAVATDGQGKELARFNNYFIKSKTDAQFLRDHIEDLRTHCSKVRDHAMQIGNQCKGDGFMALFATALNLRDPQREQQLAQKLDRLAFEDFAVANSANQMVTSLDDALQLVQDALGTGGAMYPENIPAAAEVLAALASAFEQIEQQATQALRDVQQSAASIT
jgi:uncharacterized phage infection (PIP) family protein YhgE